jgi:hypothetical protein
METVQVTEVPSRDGADEADVLLGRVAEAENVWLAALRTGSG